MFERVTKYLKADIVNHLENKLVLDGGQRRVSKTFFVFAFYAVGTKCVAIYVQLKITFDKELFSIFTNLIYFSF